MPLESERKFKRVRGEGAFLEYLTVDAKYRSLGDDVGDFVELNKGLISQGMLSFAIRHGRTKAVEAMLSSGKVDVNAPSFSGGPLPIESAASGGDMAITKLLIQKGADMVVANPLQYIKDGDVEMAKLLVENGAPIDQKDHHGRTPADCSIAALRLAGLDEAKSKSHIEILKCLIGAAKEQNKTEYAKKIQEELKSILLEQATKPHYLGDVKSLMDKFEKDRDALSPVIRVMLSDNLFSKDEIEEIEKKIQRTKDEVIRQLEEAARSEDEKRFITVLRKGVGAITKALVKLGYNLTIRPLFILVNGVKELIVPDSKENKVHDVIQDTKLQEGWFSARIKNEDNSRTNTAREK